MENNCPCCPNHCPADNLRCGKGRAYFGRQDAGHEAHGERPVSPAEKPIVLLRKCGHFLHHNFDRGADTSQLMSALTPEERDTLERLLQKCLDSWERG